jgi:enterochelin esterase-like enzyme
MLRGLIVLAFAVLSLGAFPSGGRYAGGGSPGVMARPIAPLIQTLGTVTHVTINGADTPARVITDMNYLGAFNVRDFVQADATKFGVIAAAHAKFDNATSSWNSCSGTSTATYLSNLTTELDTFVGLYPGSVPFVDGQNEINNFPPCYLITAPATSSAGAVVNFSAVPASVVTTATATYGSGIVATDVTTPGNIPGGATVVSATTTTVTLSASTTVAGSDVIQFKANGTNPASGITWQTDIYNTVHADATLAGTQITNFTDFPNYGVAGTADLNNQHPYPTNGAQPGWQNPAQGPPQIAGLPVVFTETGYNTVTTDPNGVDQTRQAIFALNNIFDSYILYNVPDIWFYELIDDGTDSNPFNNEGIFTNSNVPKTAATVLKNFITIMSDGGGTFSPGRLNYSISGLPTPSGSFPTGTLGGFSGLFQKSNGNYYIIIWNEPQIWNATTHAPVTPSTSSLTVNLGLTAATVNVYDPITSTTPISTASSVSSVTPSITADPLIVEIIPSNYYTVSPPPISANIVTSPSLPFTVTLGTGTFSGSQTITISDGGNGGTITPSVGSPGTSTVVVTPTVSTTSFTFTYTGATAGNKTISFANAQGWHDAQAQIYYPANPIPPYDGTVWNNPGGCCGGDTGVAHGTYHSNLLNTTIGYVIYTPPGYPTGGPFPVVYFLTGSGSNENSWIGVGSPDPYGVVQAAIVATTIKPMIVVTFNSTYFGDNRDAQPGSTNYGTWPPQTMLIYEGIAHIDATYSTIANKTGRALQGFSMGGQACMRFATKFPQMFSSAYCIAPASDDVAPNYPICVPGVHCSDVTSSDPTELSVLFNNSTAAYQNDSVWGSGAYNAPNINGLPIHVLVGSLDALDAVAVDYFTLLDYAGVAHDALTVASGCGHDYSCDVGSVGVNVPWQYASTNFP